MRKGTPRSIQDNTHLFFIQKRGVVFNATKAERIVQKQK